MLRLSSVARTYPGGIAALRDVNLDVPRGMFGLLGPNGAGKSTLMRTIATLQAPDSGTITFDGIDVLRDKTALRRVLGYLPQEFGTYPAHVRRTMLRHFAALKGLHGPTRTAGRSSSCWSGRTCGRRASAASRPSPGGMKQRYGIAQALLGSPRLLIVDEPTAGLDPAERRRFQNLLAEVGEDVVVILSTHIVDDVADLCPRLAIMGQGRILEQGEADRLVAALRGRLWTTLVPRDETAAVHARFPVLASRLKGRMEMRVLADSPARPMTPAAPTLEDVYFADAAAARPDCATSTEPCARFSTFSRFELRLQCRSPLFAGALLLFFVIHLLTMSQVGIHLSDNELIDINSAYLIFRTELVLGIFGMLPAMIFVVNATTRDYDRRTMELFFTTPVGKLPCLLGRFCGGTICALLAGVAGLLGTVAGTFMPWLDQDRLGSFDAVPYAAASSPSSAEPADLLRDRFSVAALRRSQAWAFAVALAFMVARAVRQQRDGGGGHRLAADARSLRGAGDRPGHAILDRRRAQHATADQPCCWRTAPLWMGIALSTLAVTAGTRPPGASAQDGQSPCSARGCASRTRRRPAPPAVEGTSRFAVRDPLAQLASQLRIDLRSVVLSPLFGLIIAVHGRLARSANSRRTRTASWDLPLHPLTGADAWLLPLRPLSVRADRCDRSTSATLIHREREHGLAEMIGASPHPDWLMLVVQDHRPSCVAVIAAAAGVDD